MTKSSFLKKGGFVLPAILLSAGFFVFHQVSAYDPQNTHRALTYEAGKFYDLNYGKRLASDDLDALMQGAEDEDTPPRWINHFYNPDTGDGWVADKLGSVPKEILTVFSQFALSSRSPISSKNWAKNRLAQADYYLYGGDQTWQRAIELYAGGDRQGGLSVLGHTLHLIEDLTVPDHTRNDTHLEGVAGDKGSALEIYAKEQTVGKIKNLKIAENLYQAGIKPLNLPILENYFDATAKYSHDNFFSNDTIENYNVPVLSKTSFFRIGNEDFIRGFAKNSNDEYPVMIAAVSNKGGKIIFSNYSISDPVIMSAYWSRLSKQAVISGAGVINLFFQEVEKYKKAHPNLKPAVAAQNNIGVISPYGELVKLNKFFVQVISGAEQLAANILPQAGKTEVNIDEIASSPAAPRNDINQNTQFPAPTPSNSPSGRGRNQTPPPVTLNSSLKSADEIATSQAPRNDIKTEEKIYVSRVVDGDTVILSNGKDVRLIGMNTPEVGEKCAAEATQELKSLVLGKYITTEKDVSETDKYGRLLLFIYSDGIFINTEMVKLGFAHRMTIPPDTKYADDFKRLESEAKDAHRGCLWAQQEAGGGLETDIVIDDRGPYYGGASWAGAAGKLDNNATSPVPNNALVSISDQASTSTLAVIILTDSATSTLIISTTSTSKTVSTSTLSDIFASSTPENTATSTLKSTTASTAETATSTPAAHPPTKIIINEIQISGATADDEFVELYNPNDGDIDITSWKLTRKTASGTSEYNLVSKFSASTTIPARSYFLIVPQSYGAPADATYTGASASFHIADDNTIILKDAVEHIIDTVGFGQAAVFEGAPAPNSPKKQSINRQNFVDTDNNLNDFIIASSTPQGTSSTPIQIVSLPPPAPPPQPVICVAPSYDDHKNYAGTADTSKTLPFPPIAAAATVTLSSGQTYYVRSSSVPPKVPANSRLIIPEGVVIKFGPWEQGSWDYIPPMLIIEGDLEIDGTKNNPVVFTTFRDDRFGAAINMSTSTPAPGDWGYVEIDSRAGKQIKIQNAKFLYGGGKDAAITVNGDAEVDISGTEFKYNKAAILAKFLYNAGNLSSANNNFEYNGVYGAKINDIKNILISLTGNSFKCNGWNRGNTAVGSLDAATTDSYWSGAVFTIRNNNFWGAYQLGVNYNKGYHLMSDNITTILDAANNYWGDASGPYNQTANSAGKGSAVSNYVNFTPWSIAPGT